MNVFRAISGFLRFVPIPACFFVGAGVCLMFRMFIVQEKRNPKGLFCLANRTVGKIFCDCEGATTKETGDTTKEITSNANGTTKETIKETIKETSKETLLNAVQT